MKIKNGQIYKIVETDDYLCITQTKDNVAGNDVQPLIIADREKLCGYLMAYLTNREHGKPSKLAHNEAMEYVGITLVKH